MKENAKTDLTVPGSVGIFGFLFFKKNDMNPIL